MKKIFIVLLILTLFITFIGCNSSSLSNKNQTSVNFEVKGYFKGSSDKGMIRVQSVYVETFKDDVQIWNEIEDYAKELMWTSGDVSIIFFFADKNNMPMDEITFASDFNVAMDFPEKYNQYCIAGYWHYADGKESFTQYPFK